MANLKNKSFSLSHMTDLVMSATTNFDGMVPDGATSGASPGRIIFGAGTSQGLIDPAALGVNTPLRILRVQLFMAGQSTWTIALVDGSDIATLETGTTEAFVNKETCGYLNGGQKLKITTTGGGTSAVKAVVTVADPYMFSPGPRGV
jgi:hypothetical protein